MGFKDIPFNVELLNSHIGVDKATSYNLLNNSGSGTSASRRSFVLKEYSASLQHFCLIKQQQIISKENKT